MVDRHIGHGHIEVFLLFVKSYFDSAEIYLKSSNVLFLFHNNLLLLSTEAGFLFLKLNLSLTSFLFTFTVLLLFDIVHHFLLVNRDWLRFAVKGDVLFFVSRDRLKFIFRIILSYVVGPSHDFLIINLTVG